MEKSIYQLDRQQIVIFIIKATMLMGRCPITSVIHLVQSNVQKM